MFLDFTEHNITEIFKPAVHVGAKQELKQYQKLQKNGRIFPRVTIHYLHFTRLYNTVEKDQLT